MSDKNSYSYIEEKIFRKTFPTPMKTASVDSPNKGIVFGWEFS